MNEILNISNVHGYMDKQTGTAYLNAEDVARGLGFTTVAKSGNEVVRWARVNTYLHEFGFSPQVGKDDFLPENMVYRLGFKASNEVAQKFQTMLADEVLPAIRRHGAYMTDQALERAITEPDFLIRLATQLKEEQAKRKQAELMLEEQKPAPKNKHEALLEKVRALMRQAEIPEETVKEAVGKKGYFPADMSIDQYPDEFIDGVLIGAWKQIKKFIEDEKIPF